MTPRGPRGFDRAACLSLHVRSVWFRAERGPSMFDAQCDLAALVYEEGQDPDAVLRDFADELKASGRRVVGMVQSGQGPVSSLSAVLVHTGEVLLLAQPATPPGSGCKLDLS